LIKRLLSAASAVCYVTRDAPAVRPVRPFVFEQHHALTDFLSDCPWNHELADVVGTPRFGADAGHLESAKGLPVDKRR